MSTTAPGVLLISPGIIKWTDMDFGLPHLVSMGGWLREHTGVRVELLDLNYEGGDHHTLLRTIESLGPHLLIGVSCYSSFDYLRVMALARFLRDRFPDVPLVTGGYHASALPDDVVFDGSPFDAVILGEGERPLADIVRHLLGGGRLEQRLWGPDLIDDLDELPPYAWDLLDRYWPRATAIGRKLQIYLSRGCPYHCTFCMERSKSGYRWRSYSPGRAVEELRRLASFTDLSRWVINIADPLFGFKRSWRREVLEGIVEHGLLPRAYWTLTRSDDLDETDIDLLARARFSIGIGLESGSPSMLVRMQKGNTPENYLGAVERLARLSQEHGLTWAVNVIVGHPGETLASMKETRDFVRGLFTRDKQTRGWLSVDPFRLYPGSAVAEQREQWSADHGAQFHHPIWWKSWYDHGFLAQHLEPSRELGYEDRVRFMYDTYGPVLGEIQRRFVGQGRDVDGVYTRSIRGQLEALSPEVRDRMIHRGRQAVARPAEPRAIRFPLGLHVRDPWVRLRESAVRRLLDAGWLRTEDLVEALLQVGPERFMGPDEATEVLGGRTPDPVAEGLLPVSVGIGPLAAGLEALEPARGDTIVDCTARSGYVAALLSHLVGPSGWVVAHHPDVRPDAAFLQSVALLDNVEAIGLPLARVLDVRDPVDRCWIGAALPRVPRHLVHAVRDGGRVVTFLGPRYRAQDLVSLTRDGDRFDERVVLRVRVPVLAGPHGWIARPAEAAVAQGAVRFVRQAAPAVAYHVLAHLDLGDDAASLFRDDLGPKPWASGLRTAWEAAPGRLVLQAAALPHDDVATFVHTLRTRPPTALRDEGGAALIEAFVQALEAEAPGFLAGWEDPDAARRLAEAGAALGPALTRLRERLWENSGQAPPPLRVIDCPALGRAGRATSHAGERLVAVSLAQGTSHALCQVLHEEMHPITDPHVLGERAVPGRDTRVGSEGWSLHAELEAVAVAATEAFLDARAPELMPDFRRWRARFTAEPAADRSA